MNEEVPSKTEGTRVVLTLIVRVRFFRRSKVANSEFSGGILPKFELTQAFMVVLVTCKNEKRSDQK